MQYIEIIYTFFTLIFIFFISIIKKKYIFFKQKKYNLFFINVSIKNNISLIIFEESNEIIKKQELSFDLFCENFFLKQKLRDKFLDFLKNEQKFFYYNVNIKKKRNSFFFEKISKKKENRKKNDILVKLFYFENHATPFDDCYNFNETQKKIVDYNKFFKKTKFFIRIDLYAEEILEKEHLILIIENIYSIIGDKKIYITPNKILIEEKKISLFIIDLFNNKIKNIEFLTDSILDGTKKLLKKLCNNEITIYAGILKNKNMKKLDLEKIEIEINNLMEFGLEKNIAVINEKNMNNFEQIKEDINNKNKKKIFVFKNILNTENNKKIGEIVNVYVNKKNINILDFGYNSQDDNLIIEKFFLKLFEQLKISPVQNDKQDNKNIINIFLENISYTSIYNKKFLFSFIQKQICEKFNIKIFIYLNIEENFEFSIIEKINLINYLNEIKSNNDKIKFYSYINDDFFLNSDMFNIVDAFLIKYSNNNLKIIEKLLKHKKTVILKINNLKKIKKLIENNIVKYAVNDKCIINEVI